MGTLPHVGPERFDRRGFEAQEVITLVLELPANIPSHVFQGHTWTLELFFRKKAKVKLSIKVLHTQCVFSLPLTIYLSLLDLFEPMPSMLDILSLQSSKIPQSNLMVYEERLKGLGKVDLSSVNVNHNPQ